MHETFRCQVCDDQSWFMKDCIVSHMTYTVHRNSCIPGNIGCKRSDAHTSFVHCYKQHIQWHTHKEKKQTNTMWTPCLTISLCVNLVHRLKSEWWNKVLRVATVQVQSHFRGRECHKWLQLMLKAIKNYWTEPSQPVLALWQVHSDHSDLPLLKFEYRVQITGDNEADLALLEGNSVRYCKLFCLSG